MTRSSELSRVEPTCGGLSHKVTAVTRSRAREGRGISVISEVETRPEVEKPAGIQVSVSANREGRFGATRPYISDTASQYVTADRPETAAAFMSSPAKSINDSTSTQTATFHT